MKTLDEVATYFREKGYFVRSYSNLAGVQPAIAVHGRASDMGYMGLIKLGSTAIIIFSDNIWRLTDSNATQPRNEPFDTLENLLIAAEEILGPPKEPIKDV